MDRRDFIVKGIKLTGLMLTGSGLAELASSLLTSNFPRAQASANLLFNSHLNIVDTHFTFADLEERPATNRIIIHHSGVAGNPEMTAADVNRIHKENGWAGIGYHMFIRKNGLIETGRPLADIGAHTYHHNTDSIGICLAGNFNDEFPTDTQLKSLTGLTGLLCQMYSLHPNETTIKGHRDYNATICPGNNLYADLGQLRINASRHA